MTETTLIAAVLAVLPIITRLAAFVFTMPVVAQQVVPIRVRVAFVLALTLIIAPTTIDLTTVGSGPVSIEAISPSMATSFGLTLIGEALIGAVMGLSFSIVLAAARMVGGLLEGLCGFSVSTFGGSSQDGSKGGALSNLFWWTTLAVFVAMGGLGQLVNGVLSSFKQIPAGQAWFDKSFLDLLVTTLSQSFYFALAAALPAVAAMLVASLVLGMTQKSFPQLGGMQVGLSIKALFAMAVASILLLTTPWIINGGFELAMTHLLDVLSTKS